MQFKVITGVISALFLLFALMQLAMGGYFAGLLFLIGAIYFLPPIQLEFKERLERPVYLSTAIGLGLVLTMTGFVFANKPWDEPDEENKTMIVQNDETISTTDNDGLTDTSIEGGSIQVDSNQSSNGQSSNGIENTPQVNTAQNPEVAVSPVNQAATTVVETQTTVTTPAKTATPVVQATPTKTAVPVQTAAPVKKPAQVAVSTPIPVRTLKPTPLNTPSPSPSNDFSQEANAMYGQLDSFLRVGQSMQADRQSDNPAAIAACNESMRNTLSDAQETKRASDLLVEKTTGLNLDKYKNLQRAATEMTSCVTCNKNQAEGACQKAKAALKEYTQQASE